MKEWMDKNSWEGWWCRAECVRWWCKHNPPQERLPFCFPSFLSKEWFQWRDEWMDDFNEWNEFLMRIQKMNGKQFKKKIKKEKKLEGNEQKKKGKGKKNNILLLFFIPFLKIRNKRNKRKMEAWRCILLFLYSFIPSFIHSSLEGRGEGVVPRSTTGRTPWGFVRSISNRVDEWIIGWMGQQDGWLQSIILPCILSSIHWINASFSDLSPSVQSRWLLRKAKKRSESIIIVIIFTEYHFYSDHHYHHIFRKKSSDPKTVLD